MQLTVDCRTGVHNENTGVANAGVDVVLSWLKKLDGKQHTLINLERLDGSSLMIGGGPSWYVAVFDDGKKNLTLQNPSGLETEVLELCAGGQYGEYPKSFCVDQNQAEQVVKLFFEGNEAHAVWA
ncbi:MAG: hypothetical protein LBF16_07880 [Pseudomonadales bacterium]|jgi:hypothetical protein|nr:hypothetical protein [Pseudomonadales bacterium]